MCLHNRFQSRSIIVNRVQSLSISFNHFQSRSISFNRVQSQDSSSSSSFSVLSSVCRLPSSVLLLLLLPVLSFASPCSLITINGSLSSNTIIVGEDLRLNVQIQNNSNLPLKQFQISILLESETTPYSALMARDARFDRGSLVAGEWINNVPAYFWTQDPLSLPGEWILPGQSVNLEMNFRAIGSFDGSIRLYSAIFDANVPFICEDERLLSLKIHYQSLTIINNHFQSLTIPSALQPSPPQSSPVTGHPSPVTSSSSVLIHKSFFVNTSFGCSPLGAEVYLLYQVVNTSDTPLSVALSDLLPARSVHTTPFFPVFIAPIKAQGSSEQRQNTFSSFDAGEQLRIDGSITIPAYSHLYFTFDAQLSGHPGSANLNTDFVVRTTEGDDPIEVRATPPALDVCTPVFEWSSPLAGSCSIDPGTEVPVELRIDRVTLNFANSLVVEHTLPDGFQFTGEATVVPKIPFQTTSPNPSTQITTLTKTEPVPNNLFQSRSISFNPAQSQEPSSTFNSSTPQSSPVTGHPSPLQSSPVTSLTPQSSSSISVFFSVLRLPSSVLPTSYVLRPTSFLSFTSAFFPPTVVAHLSYSLTAECYSLTASAFEDRNANGRRDPDEPPIADREYILYGAGSSQTARSDADGLIRFASLASGNYALREERPEGWHPSAPNTSGSYSTFSLTGDLSYLDTGLPTPNPLLFGSWKESVIAGTVFRDSNADGIRGDGELPLSGLSLRLQATNGSITTASTDADGHYRFEGLRPGLYSLSLPQPPDGFLFSFPNDGRYANIGLLSGNNLTRDMGLYREIRVHLELTSANTDSLPAYNLKVEPGDMLFDANTPEIRSLRPGRHRFELILPQFWNVTSPNPVELELHEGDTQTLHYTIFYDEDAAPERTESSITGNIVQNLFQSRPIAFNPAQSQEPSSSSSSFHVLSSVFRLPSSVSLQGLSQRGSSISRTTTSDRDGRFHFPDLPAGDYLLRITPQASDTVMWPIRADHGIRLGRSMSLGTWMPDSSETPTGPDWLTRTLPRTDSLVTMVARLSLDTDFDGKPDQDFELSGTGIWSLGGTLPDAIKPFRIVSAEMRGRCSPADPRRCQVRLVMPGIMSGRGSLEGRGELARAEVQHSITLVLDEQVYYLFDRLSIVGELPQWPQAYARFSMQPNKEEALLRDPFGRPKARILGWELMTTRGLDFGLLPKPDLAASLMGNGEALTGEVHHPESTNTSVEELLTELPLSTRLMHNFPNPFNPETTIPFSLAVAGPVKLRIFDLTGRLVATLVDGTLPAGFHSQRWNAAHLSTGLYLIVLETQGRRMTGKMALLK